MTGIGSCGRDGTTNQNTYYCGTGSECNNFDGKTCWNPIGNGQSITPCTSSQWLCKVFNFFISKYIKVTLEWKRQFSFQVCGLKLCENILQTKF